MRAAQLLAFYENFALNALLAFYDKTAQLLAYPDPMVTLIRDTMASLKLKSEHQRSKLKIADPQLGPP